MAELTLPVFLQMVQTIGILVGVFYYIMTLQNQQKSRKHVEETRKVQLLIENSQHLSGEGRNDWNHLLDMSWDTYDDFIEKYGADNNPEAFERRIRSWRRMHLSGMLLKDELIDISTYVQYIGDVVPIMWDKFKDIILEQRRIWDSPDYLIGFEYLAEEVAKYKIKSGTQTPSLEVYRESLGRKQSELST